jgi:hypothetical protein
MAIEPNNIRLKKQGAIGTVLGNTLGIWGHFWERDGNILSIIEVIF